MNCANHPDRPAAAFCRECGKPMCEECQRPALGSIFCAEHVPAPVAAEAPSFTPPPPPPPPEPGRYAGSSFPAPSSVPPSPYTAPAPPPQPTFYRSDAHPVLALLLGFIPGVGAIYNGQYAKGLIHAVIFGLLVSLANKAPGPFEPLIGILIAIWVFYMAFEAFHTAGKHRQGVQVEEFSSLIDVRGGPGRFPVGAILLIALGFILLLDTTDLIDMEQLARYWPVGLILFGLYLLYARLSPNRTDGRTDEVRQARGTRR